MKTPTLLGKKHGGGMTDTYTHTHLPVLPCSVQVYSGFFLHSAVFQFHLTQ